MATLREVIESQSNGSCSTDVAQGLSLQIINELNILVPNALVSIDDLSLKIGLGVNPYLQPAAKEALRRAIQNRGETLTITSAYRTIAQQYILFNWFQRSECDIPDAASPGRSNHEDGFAIDIPVTTPEDPEQDPEFRAWRSVLEKEGWRWLGLGDVFHFTYMGGGVRDDIGDFGISAFQQPWNKQNSNDPIKVDGLFGSETSARLDRSPVEGFGIPRILKITNPFMNGDDIRQVQQALVAAGLFKAQDVDGIFGISTETAVKNFQEQRGLRKDGVVGPQTLQELGLNGSQSRKPDLDRWTLALSKAPTNGASAITASQDGLLPGIDSSHQMAKTDLP